MKSIRKVLTRLKGEEIWSLDSQVAYRGEECSDLPPQHVVSHDLRIVLLVSGNGAVFP